MDKPPARYSNIRVHFRIWLTDQEGNGLLGEHEWKLLKYIDELGSMMAASEKLGISYRKAWGDLKRAESLLGFLLLEKTRGGEQGGKSVLTTEGAKFLEAYQQLLADFQESVDEHIIAFKKKLKSDHD